MKRFKPLILLLAAVFIFCSMASSTWALEITQLTNDDYNDANPRINNNGQVVWIHTEDDSSYPPRRITFFENGNSTILPWNEKYTSYVDINDSGHVASMGYSEVYGLSNTSISIYDGISLNLVSAYGIVNDFNNNWLTWSGSGGGFFSDLYLYDGTSSSLIGNGLFADVNESGQVIWVAGQEDWWPGISFFDGLSASIIDDGLMPSVNDREQKVWLSYSDGNTHMLDNAVDTIIYQGFVDYRLNNLGQVIYFSSDTNGMNQLYLYENGSTIQITNNTGQPNTTSVQINDKGQIVWAGYEFDDPTSSYIPGLYVYDGQGITKIHDGRVFSSDIDLNDNGDVVWAASDGNDYEIYTTKIISGVCDPSELVEMIIVDIEILFPGKAYNKYDANLKKIAMFLENGQIDAAINQLEAVMNKLAKSGLDGTVLAELINRLTAMIELINTPCPN